MQKGLLNPLPDFLNMVWPHTGQSSLVGTSQVRKSQRWLSSAAVARSQQ